MKIHNHQYFIFATFLLKFILISSICRFNHTKFLHDKHWIIYKGIKALSSSKSCLSLVFLFLIWNFTLWCLTPKSYHLLFLNNVANQVRNKQIDLHWPIGNKPANWTTFLRLRCTNKQLTTKSYEQLHLKKKKEEANCLASAYFSSRRQFIGHKIRVGGCSLR